MASLTGQKIKDTYQSLLKTDDNGLITNAFKGVTDGSGSASGLYLKSDGVQVNGSLVVSGSLLYSGSTINATVSSASFALTASYALNGESTDLSGYATTASLNAFTASYNTGSFTGSFTGDLIGSSSYALTASYALNGGGGGSTDTGSLLVTASVSSNTITFTKGDATTFDITVDTGSATPIDVSSFATTGSNTFVGNQTISGSIIFEDGSTIENSWAYDTNTSGSIAWSNRQLYDTSENTSVNWETRQLLDDAGNSSVLTWGGGSPEFFGTSSYALTASYLEGGVGSIHTGSFATTGSNTFIGEQTISGSIQISGSIIPATDGVSTTSSFSLGSATNAWKDIFVSNGTINFLDGAGNVQAALSSTDQGLQIQNYPADTGSIPVFNVSGSGTFSSGLTISGSISFGDGSQIQSVSASSGDGYGFATLELKPDVSLASDQYIVLDPTTNNHIHIRAGGTIDSSSAYLYLGGENNNVLIDDSGQRVQIASINAASIIGALEQGSSVIATGSYSHAQGDQTIASGSYSHAEGSGTQAIGEVSHAEGDNTQAIGEASHAEGYSTKTGTQNAYSASIVNGIITLSGSYGDVAGDFATDRRLYLYDQPFDNNYNRRVFIISQSYFDSSNTIVELYDTSVNTTTAYVGDIDYLVYNAWNGDQTIPGTYSHAEGEETQAIGYGTHAEGTVSIATGFGSHAEGSYTLAVGTTSHAEGNNTKAIGDDSHTEGFSTQAIGYASHAEGYITIASGSYSHAEGYLTIASGSAQHVSGKFNEHNNDTSYFVVGIGLTEETRKDGFTVDVDANGSGSVMIPHNLDAPSVAKTGSMYVDPANNKLWIYTGNGGVGGWVTASLG